MPITLPEVSKERSTSSFGNVMPVTRISSTSFWRFITNAFIFNISFFFPLDILSTAISKVTLLKAERTLLEAERAVQDRAVSAEKEFYTELKTLLSQASTVLADEQTLYEDEVDFKTVIAQGYAKTSSSYRTADLAVRTDTRTLEEAKRLFVHKQTVFAKKCGVASSASTTSTTATTSFDTAWAFLPTVIP